MVPYRLHSCTVRQVRDSISGRRSVCAECCGLACTIKMLSHAGQSIVCGLMHSYAGSAYAHSPVFCLHPTLSPQLRTHAQRKGVSLHSPSLLVKAVAQGGWPSLRAHALARVRRSRFLASFRVCCRAAVTPETRQCPAPGFASIHVARLRASRAQDGASPALA